MRISDVPRAGGVGRVAQRRRTRKAIVEAAGRLIAAGGTPSIADIAAAADVSRRTVYLYFPTLEHLLIDATVGALGDVVDATVIDVDDPDPRTRVARTIHAITNAARATLPLGRKLVKLTVDAVDPAPATPKRGNRRVAWIEQAIEPIRDRLSPDRFERLVSALTVLVGWEALIVLQDVRGLVDGEPTVAWAAMALIDAALAERPG